MVVKRGLIDQCPGALTMLVAAAAEARIELSM
jgi:hypothetical protein